MRKHYITYMNGYRFKPTLDGVKEISFIEYILIPIVNKNWRRYTVKGYKVLGQKWMEHWADNRGKS